MTPHARKCEWQNAFRVMQAGCMARVYHHRQYYRREQSEINFW